MTKEIYLKFAETIGELATCPRAKCGTVVVDTKGTIIGVGHNGAAFGEPTCLKDKCIIEGEHCVRAVHSEVAAVLAAARAGLSTYGATAYLSQRPCQGCLSVMAEAGIRQVWYLHDYHSTKHKEEYCSPDLNNLLRVTQYVPSKA